MSLDMKNLMRHMLGSVVRILPSTAVTVHCPSKCFSMPGLARVNCMVPAALS